jgi:hypothetical protein
MNTNRPAAGDGGQPEPAQGELDRLGEFDDDQLLTALGEVLRASGPPPDWSVELAKATFGLRAADAELARLTSDSDLATARSALRGAGAPRLTVFDATDLSVEIQIEAGTRAGSWQLTGQLMPPMPARIQVRQPGAEPFWIDADDLGRFAAGQLRDGPLSLICERPGLPPAVTQWIAIG